MDRIISSQTETQWFKKIDETNSQSGRPNSGAHL